MLETPLYGRFLGEGRRLVFAAPLPYHAFVRGTAIVGGLMFVAPILPVDLPLYPMWWHMIGFMVMGAAALAALSLQSVVFDLKERIYRRRQGPGLVLRGTSGRLDMLDAVVVIAEPHHASIPPSVTFHVMLHWKGGVEPPMVLQRETRSLSTGQPLNAHAGTILQRAASYAQALGVQFFDNSYFASPNPVPLLQA